MKQSYTTPELLQLALLFFEGRPMVKAEKVMLRKLATGYPPSQTYIMTTALRYLRTSSPFTPNEKEFIRWWWECRVAFKDPRIVAMYHRSRRTKDYQPPPARYLCALLGRSPGELRDYVKAHFEHLGGFQLAVKPAVIADSEWS